MKLKLWYMLHTTACTQTDIMARIGMDKACCFSYVYIHMPVQHAMCNPFPPLPKPPIDPRDADLITQACIQANKPCVKVVPLLYSCLTEFTCSCFFYGQHTKSAHHHAWVPKRKSTIQEADQFTWWHVNPVVQSHTYTLQVLADGLPGISERIILQLLALANKLCPRSIIAFVIQRL